MRLWTTEYGTFWALETAVELPPMRQAAVNTTFAEVDEVGDSELAQAMGLAHAGPIRQRRLGRRRCFGLWVDDAIAAYGWVTLGPERAGELEREFNLEEDEAYLWDFATLPAWQGRGLYSALLSQIIRRLADEGVPRIWIGASRLNRPSVRGMANAGFLPIIDCNYHRWLRLTWMWLGRASPTQPTLVAAARRILLTNHEWRLGPVALGWLR
jgi:GNAT superfamily N-acetyltransferase